MRNIAISMVISSFIFSTKLFAEPRSVDDLITQEEYAVSQMWKLPDEFTLPRIEHLLQQVSDQIYGTGFRVIGDHNDWFHGHLLYTADQLTPEGRLKPFAILYHTQEEAYPAHWGDGISYVDPKFDYVDVRTRNWVQWLSDDPALDGKKIVNAREYNNDALQPSAIFFGDNIAVKKQHYTIHGKNLDPKKLGVTPVGEMQWEFYSGEGQCRPFADETQAKGPIFVRTGVEQHCLKVVTTSVFLRHPRAK